MTANGSTSLRPMVLTNSHLSVEVSVISFDKSVVSLLVEEVRNTLSFDVCFDNKENSNLFILVAEE